MKLSGNNIPWGYLTSNNLASEHCIHFSYGIKAVFCQWLHKVTNLSVSIVLSSFKWETTRKCYVSNMV